MEHAAQCARGMQQGLRAVQKAGFVVQGEDDEFYLKHDFERKEDLFGSIFLGHHNDAAFTDSHSFIYGHNMEGHMMFANLNQYEQPEFLEKLVAPCLSYSIFKKVKCVIKKTFGVTSNQAMPESTWVSEYCSVSA